MKLKLNKIQRAIILIALGCFLGANLYIRLAPCPASYFEAGKDSTLENPDIGDVISASPSPGLIVSWGCYTKKILQTITIVELFWNPKWPSNYGVTASVFAKFEKAPNAPSSSFPYYEDTVLMYLDRQQIPIGIAARTISTNPNPGTYPEIGWFTFQSLPFLFPGEHTAKLVYVMPSGEKREYEWHFTITLW